jgi:hypothetical protein
LPWFRNSAEGLRNRLLSAYPEKKFDKSVLISTLALINTMAKTNFVLGKPSTFCDTL